MPLEIKMSGFTLQAKVVQMLDNVTRQMEDSAEKVKDKIETQEEKRKVNVDIKESENFK